MSKSLDGKTALVTGGGGPAMGSAHCHALAKLGAHVIVQDMREDHAAAVVADIHAHGGSAEPMAGDITDLDPFLVSLNEAISSTGGIDILVNHAGISGLSTPLADIDQDFFDRMMNVHVKGSFFIAQAVVPEMKEPRATARSSTSPRSSVCTAVRRPRITRPPSRRCWA